ncbi:MAG: GTPase HflX, partial [Proteobacteria bacterium]|nr:GTPase HflX [Pseudomonadota bacterium]
MSALASSAGAVPVGVVTGSRQHPDPRFYVGSGKAEELKARAEELSADVILVDHALSPSQERNLEKLIGRRVLGRNGLILDIFAQRARSHEGKLQVELAQLKHLQTRLVRGWTHLERQAGGIGMRGPGESPFQLHRAPMTARITILKRKLKEIQKRRALTRDRRPWPVACL